MSDEVCLAARIPASRAVCSGSPLATAPRRISASACALIEISPRATASRLVTGLSPTSTIRAFPRASTCDSRARVLAIRLIALREVEGEAFERDRQVHALQLQVGRDFQRTGRDGEDRIDSGGQHLMYPRLLLLVRQ